MVGVSSVGGTWDYVFCRNKASEYTCILDPTFFGEHCYVHQFPPSAGQLARVAEDYLSRARTEAHVGLHEPIALLAMDPQQLPTKQSVIILGNESLWFGLLVAIHKAVRDPAHIDAEVVQKLGECLRRIKVTFHLCKGSQITAKKWKLDAKAASVNEAQTLRGFKRIHGFMEVAAELECSHQRHDAEAVALFLKAAGVQISSKVLSSLFLAHKRLTSAPGCMGAIEEMDSRFGADHWFANTGVLVTLCQRTSIAGNPLLANSLLSWVALALVTKP